MNSTAPGIKQPLRDTKLSVLLDRVKNDCTECGICVGECAFLKRHGSPKQIAGAYDPQRHRNLPFECHLCDLCTAVCPHALAPSRLFLEMRRQTFALGRGHFSEHNSLRGFERRGTSKLFTWYSLPEGCDTVFFPGCALSGSRPEITYKAYKQLQRRQPTIGIVLDCCTKPSHDLGDQNRFSLMFSELVGYLVDKGVKNVLVACPNCQRMFSDYGTGLQTRTLYESLAEQLSETERPQAEPIVVHDPCVTRFCRGPQQAVRTLLGHQGFKIIEPRHTRERTLCCGEGAGVKSLAPHYAEKWKSQRIHEAGAERIVSYCAACTANFSGRAHSNHLLDLLFDRDRALSDTLDIAKAPRTYFNRLGLKRRLRTETPAGATTRERTLRPDGNKSPNMKKKLALLTLLTLALGGFHSAGGTDYLERDRLQALIAGYGLMAPLAYMLLYSIAPVFFLPGLPLGIVGGILFGPVWGVVFTISSATAGACLAFLISRYLARDLIEAKLKGPKWQKLNEQVEHSGWKMVALTRLIPLFPFNLLNYAFGLTAIRFSHYCLATFIFMLPGTVAVVAFSSSLPDLLRGHLSFSAILGMALLILLSLIPLFYRRAKKGRLEA